jgi:DNA-binding IclR family transcriptional regulator
VVRDALPPTYRSLQQTMQLGQATAQRYLQAMLEEGLIKRVGRRYQLAVEGVAA